MLNSGIYVILNLINDKFYVGSAKSLKSRWVNHRSQLNRKIHPNRFLQSSWNKYGEFNFLFVIIEYVYNECDLINREQHWINKLSPIYNVCKVAGSSLGVKHSEEFRIKISQIQIGKKQSEESKRKRSLSLLGRVISKETRAAISKANKGRVVSEQARLAISNANKNRIGRKYNKAIRIWACPDGRKCRCLNCMEKKNAATRKSKQKARLLKPKKEFILIKPPLIFNEV